ncbi:MAG: GAF domain-containing protein [Bacteroidales bacterium]|nr:GAF domain-containing protein [Bacteroidales bacterium]
MIQFFRKMAVRTKLLSSFLLLASFVLILGLTAIFIQQKIKVSQQNTLSSINLSDAFFEGKYFLRSDMHLFTVLMKTKTEERLNYWWGEHSFQVQFFNDQIIKIEKEFENETGFENDTLKNSLFTIINTVRNDYTKKMLPIFIQFKELKIKELAIDSQLSQLINRNSDVAKQLIKQQDDIKERYNDLDQIITQTGLQIILKLDEGKDKVRLVVKGIETHGKALMVKSFITFLVFTILGVFFSLVVAWYISILVTYPVQKILQHVYKLGRGEHPEKLHIKLDDEFGSIQKSLNDLTESLMVTSEFSKEIGNGNFDSQYKTMSENDILGNSLLQMRDSLKKAHDLQNQRREEDDRRSWASNGFAKFSDILRHNNDDFRVLCDNVIKNIVKYIDANQGGIFLLNEEDKHDQFFELISTFAWDRKKYINKRIEKAEGIVGACALEKETIIITDVPEDYVAITSGIGKAKPTCVILVPLKHEEIVLGVIEMASFKVIEKYQIDFLEKVAESIASTISAVKINSHTKFLLEQSQQQSEEMSAQEEEMRQNIEELQATQEEAARKSGEIEGLLKSLNAAAYMVEYDLNGNITNINDEYLQRLGVTHQQIVGTHHSGNVEMTQNQKKEYATFWDDLRVGKSKKVKSKINWDGKMVDFIETYFPVTDGEGNVFKVMKMSHEFGDFKD